jgi:hypothetical protein
MISHSEQDSKLASMISDFLSEISLGLIKCWYSSDHSPNGGMQVGEQWYERIQSELKGTQHTIILLTRNSINSNWVLFEAGFAAATGSGRIIPLSIGLPIKEIGLPLSAYQIFNIDSPTSLKNFLGKLLEASSYQYSANMIDPMIEQLIPLIHKNKINNNELRSKKSTGQRASPEVLELIKVLERNLEFRMFELGQIIKEKKNPI